MEKPNEEGLALLQAKHFYDEVKIVAVEDGGGFTVGKDTLTLKVNRLAWGYFEQSLLNALKGKPHLQAWSPELFGNAKHEDCTGHGKFPFTPGTPEYDEIYDDHKSAAIDFGDPIPEYGVEIARFCSGCQGTGFVLKPQPSCTNPNKAWLKEHATVSATTVKPYTQKSENRCTTCDTSLSKEATDSDRDQCFDCYSDAQD